MNFAHTRTGEPLEELAARVYAFEGAPSAAELRSAGRALRDANPFLRKLSEVPEGTLVIVPELEEASPAPTTAPVEGTAAELVVGQLREAAAQAVKLLTGELDDEVADARSSLDLLRSPEVRRLVREDEEAKRRHKATTEAAKGRLEAAKRLQEYRRQVEAQVESDLEELLAALRVRGGPG